MRALFFGTPEIAVPSLRALTEVAEIKGVVCQPDRPAGRGLKLHTPEVKRAAEELGLEVFQPQRVKDGTLEKYVREKQVDVALVIAYGRILPSAVLRAPLLGCVNLHASLLPRYRGAAPIQRALMNGEQQTGVCLMQMDEGMDTGAVLACRALAITRGDDQASLASRLAQLAAEITREELPRFARGELRPVPQDENSASYAPPILAQDAWLSPSRPAPELENQIRGLAPRPGAWAFLHRPGEPARRLKLLQGRATSEPGEPGLMRIDGANLLLGCGSGSLLVEEAQVEGKRPQLARDLVNGRVIRAGDRLQSPAEESVSDS